MSVCIYVMHRCALLHPESDIKPVLQRLQIRNKSND